MRDRLVTRKILAGSVLVSLIVVAERPLLGQASAARGSIQLAGVPKFEVEPGWLKLPSGMVMGVVSSVSVDRQDHVWVLHRPRTVADDRRDYAAPAVLEFDPAGRFVQGWGGPGDGYEWPETEHGVFVDYKDNVWIGGSHTSDHMLLKFTNRGKFLLQIGRRGQSSGNKDTNNVRRVADQFVYSGTSEVFVADGYGNRRLIVFDADTGAFRRMWGAFGNTPLDASASPSSTPPARGTGAGPSATSGPQSDDEGPGPQQFTNLALTATAVHGIAVSNDGLVYVCDRDNKRIQVFTLDGKYVTQAFINRKGASPRSAARIAFSPDPQQQFMYVADHDAQVVVVNRKTLEILDAFGTRGNEPGEFQTVHHLASDSMGNLYIAESAPANRIQKFVFKGMSATR